MELHNDRPESLADPGEKEDRIAHLDDLNVLH
jgi:hypothetical protein